MKHIKFQKLNILSQAIPLGIAITLLFLSFFDILEKEPSTINRILSVIAYLILTVHFAQSFWHQYYVSYNKKAVTIRLSRNILKERTFQFKHLSNIIKSNHIIKIQYRNKEEELNLGDFAEESQLKLYQILKNEA